MNNILTQEDIKFLKELAHDLKTQDTDCTATPVFFQIMQRKDIYGIDSDYADDMCIVIGDEYDTFTAFGDAIDFCEEYFSDSCNGEEWEMVKESNSLEEIHEFLKDIEIDSTYTGYQKNHEYENSFLTRRACEMHIKRNHYHYKTPVVYTNHAWRNPEFERLMQIVQKFADHD